MKTISTERLAQIIAGITHAQPVSFSAMTDAEARNNPYGKIRKLSRVNAFVSFDYGKSVNHQLEKNGKAQDFEAQGRKWGHHLNSALITKGGKFYLAAKVEKASKPIYFTQAFNGVKKIVSAEKIAEFLPEKKEETIVYRNYALDNILSFAMGGEKYRVIRS